MSLLIPGKEMPETCGECPCFFRSGYDLGCKLIVMHTNEYSKPEKCPLIEVTHCKDCELWCMTMPEEERKKAAENPWTDGVCELYESDGFSPNDFCSNARKREDSHG